MTHAHKRLIERYPNKKWTKLTHTDAARIIKKITRLVKEYSPKVMFKRNAAGGAGIYAVRVAGREVTVVFDQRYKKVITVLPKEAA